MATVTAMEPPESLLTQLDRLAPPPPWLTVTDCAASLVIETCTMALLGGDHLTHLPPELPIHISAPLGAGSVMPRLQVRAFEPWPAPERPQALLTLFEAGGTSHQLEVCRGDGQAELCLDGGDATTLSQPGWLDIDIEFKNASATATISHRDCVTYRLEGLSLPLDLTLSDALFDPDEPETAPTAAIYHGGQPKLLARHEALAHIGAVGERLDCGLPGWRTPNGDATSSRPLLVFAGRQEVRRGVVLPTGRIEVLGFLSEGWQKRLGAEEWAYALRDGTPVDEARLDAYGRAGGLIAYSYDRRWEMPAADDKATATDPLQSPATVVYEGSRDSWVACMRNTETMLYQFATVWYLGRQTSATDSIEATSTLAAALDDLWHPTYAFHLDVVQILARAIGRYRFSDPDYTDRAPLVLAELRDRLGARGVAARTVVLS